MTIAEFVKIERHNLKMTQVRFAPEVNVSVLSILSHCRKGIFEKNHPASLHGHYLSLCR